MDYKRVEIGDKIGFTTVIDEKFKSALLTVRFILPLDKDTAADNIIGMSLLSDTNSEYRTIAALNEAVTELYGSGISSFSRKRGDMQILGLTASWLASRFSLYGEDIQGEMLKIFGDCLFRPNIENGGFDSESFAIGQRELLDRIDSELNNKRGFTLTKLNEIAFDGEPAAVFSYGSRENAEKVTAASAFEAYKRILETARIEAFFIASEDDPNVETMLREGFSAIERCPAEICFRSPSRLKPEPVTVSDEYDVRQCKMAMAFKFDSEDVFALRLMSTLLGETPVSKFFINVREKLSLCYYCACQLITTKNTLIVDSGVERNNIEKAKEEIMRQIDEVCKGNISDDELQSAMLSTEDALDQVGDTPASYSSWYFERFCEGNIITPSEMTEDFKKVTKERIMAAAGTLKLDSVYLMLDKEAKE